MPPDPFSGQESLSATYSLAGAMNEVVALMATNLTATWVFNGTMTEQGTLNAVISPPDPATGISLLSSMFAQTGVSRGPWVETRGGGLQNVQWNSVANVQSIGNLMETLPPGGASMTASFWQQDQATECLMQVIPFHPPQPCITINAVFNTWGSVTENVLIPPGPNLIPLSPPGPTIFPEVDTGTTQYTDQLTETIMMPDGSMQTLTQTSMDMGSFVSIVFPIPTCTSC